MSFAEQVHVVRQLADATLRLVQDDPHDQDPILAGELYDALDELLRVAELDPTSSAAAAVGQVYLTWHAQLQMTNAMTRNEEGPTP